MPGKIPEPEPFQGCFLELPERPHWFSDYGSRQHRGQMALKWYWRLQVRDIISASRHWLLAIRTNEDAGLQRSLLSLQRISEGYGGYPWVNNAVLRQCAGIPENRSYLWLLG